MAKRSSIGRTRVPCTSMATCSPRARWAASGRSGRCAPSADASKHRVPRARPHAAAEWALAPPANFCNYTASDARQRHAAALERRGARRAMPAAAAIPAARGLSARRGRRRAPPLAPPLPHARVHTHTLTSLDAAVRRPHHGQLTMQIQSARRCRPPARARGSSASLPCARALTAGARPGWPVCRAPSCGCAPRPTPRECTAATSRCRTASCGTRWRTGICRAWAARARSRA